MENAMMIAAQIVIMFLLMSIGYFMYKKHYLTKTGRKQLSDMVVKFVIPALLLISYQADFSQDLVSGLLWAFLLSFISVVVSIFIARLMIKNSDTEKALDRFTIIYSNCAFIGIPLINGVYGSEGVLYVTAYITFFNLFVWSHGVMMMKGEISFKGFFNAIKSPTILAVAVGLVCFAFQIKFPKIPYEVLNYLAVLNTPLPMIVAGATIAETNMLTALNKPPVIISCIGRLFVVPLISMLIFKLLPVPSETVFNTVVIASACPTAALGTLLAINYNKNAVYASELFALSTLFSVITIPVIVILSGFIYNL